MKKILYGWLIAALVLLTVIIVTINTSFPIFTYIWLLIPLFVLIKKNTEFLGIKKIEYNMLIKYTLIHFVLLSIIYLVFEPWSRAYKMLIDFAINSQPADPTFIWFTKYSGISPFILMFLVTIFITIFGEELFFRGLLFQYFKNRFSSIKSIIIQSVLFALPNLILAFMMPTLQSFVFIFIYAFIAIGCVGGYTAAKTDSIWPGLISASVMNLVLVSIYI